MTSQEQQHYAENDKLHHSKHTASSIHKSLHSTQSHALHHFRHEDSADTVNTDYSADHASAIPVDGRIHEDGDSYGSHVGDGEHPDQDINSIPNVDIDPITTNSTTTNKNTTPPNAVTNTITNTNADTNTNTITKKSETISLNAPDQDQYSYHLEFVQQPCQARMSGFSQNMERRLM